MGRSHDGRRVGARLRRRLWRGAALGALGVLVLGGAAAQTASKASAADTEQPLITISDGAALEGPRTVTTYVPLPVKLSKPSSDVVTVRWTTVSGTADSVNDYHPGSGTVTFAPGDTEETITVEISGGENPEWNEYFSVFLFGATNAIIERAFAKVTIINDDGDPPGVAPGEANVAPAGGSGQCVALKDGQGCQPLEVNQLIDFDSIEYINPRAGRVELRTNVGVGSFYGGKFDVEQIAQSDRVSKPIVVLKLVGGNFRQCATKQRSLASLAAGAGAEAAKKPIRRLWGKGKGRFRTRGQYSSGTVRGTNWVTEDFCDGTRTRVVSGVVQVYDLVKKKWIVLEAGQSYFAKAGKAK